MTKVHKQLLNDVFIESIIEGSGISIDATDPSKPVISSSSVSPDVGIQLQSYWMPTNLELSETTTQALLIGMGEGNGVFDGFNSLSFVDLVSSENINTSVVGQITPNSQITETYSTVLNDNSAGYANYNVRVRVAASLISTSGTSIRLRLRGVSTGDALAISGMYLGHRASSGDAWDFDGTQTQVRVGGATSFNLASNASIITDWITYNFDETKDLIVAFHTSSGDLRVGGEGGSSTLDIWTKAGASEAATENVSGYVRASSSDIGIFDLVEVTGILSQNMVIQSQTINVSEVPQFGRFVAILTKNESGINSDVITKLSRDGIDFETLIMSEIFTRADGSVYIDSGAVDLTTLTSGSAAKWRIETVNNKNPIIKAVGVLFGKDA